MRLVTASVIASCVFPVRNSPTISVTTPVSMPPLRRLSSSVLPVVMWKTSDCRFSRTARADWKPSLLQTFPALSCALSTLASDRPLIRSRCRAEVIKIESAVW